MLKRLIQSIVWLSALGVALLPGLASLDNGGILPWTNWALALAIVLPSIVAFLTFRLDLFPTGILPHLLTLLLLFLGLYSLVQTVTLPNSLASIVAPGSHSAWTQWHDVVSLIDPQAPPDVGTKISVAPGLTLNSSAKFFMLAAVSWCGTMLFTSRSAILLLLLIPGISGAVLSLMGIYQVFLFPDYTFWSIPANHPFGVFMNRNNAAMFLNLSLACSLGLVGWRLAVITGFEFGQRGFSLTALLDLISDKVSLLGFGCIALNFAGILFCGSRGGLAGAIAGLVISIGLFSYRPLYGKLLSGLLVLTIIGVVLLVRIDVTPRTLERFGASAEGLSQSIVSNQRIEHWRDAVNAMPHYLVTGSGFGTYRFAYLPYQEFGVGWWFVNADNLWLEWALEGGLIAILPFILFIILIVYVLLQLRDTADPIDHGIVTTGWYALSAILVSQTFDFGLLLIGSASLACLIFGAILGRAAMEGLTLPLFQGNASPGSIKFKSTHYNVFGLLIGMCLVPALTFSIYRLSREATADTEIRTFVAQTQWPAGSSTFPRDSSGLDYIKSLQSSMAAADAVETKLKQFEVIPKSQEFNRLSAFQLVRILHAQLQDNVTPADDAELLKSKLELLDSEISSLQTGLRQEIAKSIGQTPLWPEPRFLYLMTSTNTLGNKPVEDELLVLRGYATESLQTLATYASNNLQWDLATTAWQRLISNSPTRAAELLSRATEAGHPDPVAIIPQQLEAVERAALVRLDQGYVDQEFLNTAFELLSQELPESRSQRAQRLLLLARIKVALKEYEASDQFFEDAILASPTYIDARLAYILSLKERGNLTDAKRYGNAMKELFGDENPRLNQLLAQIDRQIQQRND